MTEAERTITTPDPPEEAAEQAAPQAGAGAGTQAGARPAAPRSRRIAVLIGVAVLAYLLDLLSKLWVVHSLEHHDPVNVLGHYLRFDAIRNAGAAFGLGQEIGRAHV